MRLFYAAFVNNIMLSAENELFLAE